jgi:hypothetical protein
MLLQATCTTLEVLAAQSHRMLAFPTRLALALEFQGNWLDADLKSIMQRIVSASPVSMMNYASMIPGVSRQTS